MILENAVQLITKPSMFSVQSFEGFVSEGLTVSEVIDTKNLRKNHSHLHVSINGEVLPEKYWKRVRVKNGNLIEIAIIPEGGGGEKGGMAILAVVIAIAFPVLGAMAGAALVAEGGLLAGVVTVGTAQVIGGAVGTFAAAMVSSALIPPAASSAASGGQSYGSTNSAAFITGSSNTLAPFGIVPSVLGKFRITPPQAALPFPQVIDEKQYLHQLFLIGYGPNEITDMKIGETSIYEFDDVEIDIRYGFPGEGTSKLYPDEVIHESLSVTIRNKTEGVINDPVIRTTRPDCDMIVVELTFPKGLIQYDQDDGKEKWCNVSIDLKYAPAGTELWQNFPGTVSGGDTFYLRDRKGYSFKKSFSVAVDNGQYDIKISRVTDDREDSGDTFLDVIMLTGLQTVTYGSPVLADNLTLIAVKIRNSDQLSGVIQNFNCVARSIVPDFGAYDLKFNGSSDYMAMAGGVRQGADARTYECKFKITGNSQDGVGGLINAGLADTLLYTEFGLRRNESAGADSWALELGNVSPIIFTMTDSSNGEWHNVAITYDGTTISVIYDGVIVSATIPAAALNTKGAGISIAKYSDKCFAGYIKDFRVWSTCRTLTEISENYDSVFQKYTAGAGLSHLVSGVEIQDAFLKAYLPMFEGSGVMCYDHGPYYAHGTLYGPTWLESTDAKTWGLRPTSNPASLFRAVMQTRGIRKAISTERIDIAELETWHGACGSSSLVTWDGITGGMSADVYTRVSKDSGATWTVWESVSNGGIIPQIPSGANMANYCFQIKHIFKTTDARFSPIINKSSARVFGASGSAGEIADTQVEWESGTLTDLEVNSKGGLQLIHGGSVIEAKMYPYAVKQSAIYNLYPENYKIIARIPGEFTATVGDFLEYDIFMPVEDTTNMKISVLVAPNSDILGMLSQVDQNGLAVNPETDLTAYASGKWYHRKIEIPSAWCSSSKVIDWISFYCTRWTKDRPSTILVKTIEITNGGVQRYKIWDSGDASLTLESLYGFSDSFSNLSGVSENVKAEMVSLETRNAIPLVTGERISPVISCAAAGVTRAGREFNGVIDYSSTVDSVLQLLASVGRAVRVFRDGLFSVARDVPQDMIVQTFSERNSREFRGRKSFSAIPHGLKMRFFDSNNDFAEAQAIAFDDGYNYDGTDGNAVATEYTTLDIPGVTNAAQALADGRYFLFQAKLRPETFELIVDIEHLRCRKGSLVAVNHKVPFFGLQSGRIKSLNYDSSYMVSSFVTDESLEMEAGKDYGVRIRNQYGEVSSFPVQTVAGANTLISLIAPVASGFDAGDYFQFGESGEESVLCLVKEIQPRTDMSAKLTLINYDPQLYEADTGNFPSYSPQITLPPVIDRRPPQPQIREIVSDESVIVRASDGSLVTRVMISLGTVTGAEEFAYVVASHRESNGGDWETSSKIPIKGSKVFLTGFDDGKKYDIRLAYISTIGKVSQWAQYDGHFVIGKTSLPPAVNTFFISETQEGVRIFNWALDKTPIDFAGVEIRYGTTWSVAWEDMLPLHSGILTQGPFYKLGFASGSYGFRIKAVDTTGNKSEIATPSRYTFIYQYGNATKQVLIDYHANLWHSNPLEYSGVSITGNILAQVTGDLEYIYGPIQGAGLSDWTAEATFADMPDWGGGFSDVVFSGETIPRDTITDYRVIIEAEYTGGTGSSFVITDGLFYNLAIIPGDLNNLLSDGGGLPALLHLVATISATGISGPPLLSQLKLILDPTKDTEVSSSINTNTVSTRIDVGKFRVPLSGSFIGVSSAYVSFKDSDSAAWTFSIRDLNPTSGPEIWIKKDGVLADSTDIDITIVGFLER